MTDPDRADRVQLTENERREYHWKQQGINNASVLRYDRLYKAQGGACGICGAEVKQRHFDLDHDHKTGEIRGLLCWRCNKYLGHFEKDHRLLKAFNYLRKPPATKVA